MKLLKPVWVSHGFLSKDQAVGRPIYSLDIHPDGSRLATGGVVETCGIVILWNMEPIRNPTLESDSNLSRKLFQMDSHQACVNCVRWSPSGRWLASAGMDKVIMLWSKTATPSRQTTVFGLKEQNKFTEHWRCATTLRGHHGDVIDLAWSHDGYRLASTSVDNTVIIWCRQSLPHGSGFSGSSFYLQTTLKGHQGFVKGVAWDPIGRYLASQGDDLSVKIWRTADWQQEASITKPFSKASGQSQVMRLSWSLDGSTLASPHAMNNGFPTAKLIDRNNWVPSLDLVGHRKHVICARYNPTILKKGDGVESDGSVCLALGSKDRSVSVWSTAGRRARIVVHDLFTNSVCDLTWSSDGRELMACSLDGTVCYLGFTYKELGTPWSMREVIQLHHKAFGQSLLDKFDPIGTRTNGLSKYGCNVGKVSSMINHNDIVVETPEALVLQQTQAELCEKLSTEKSLENKSIIIKRLPKGPSKQIESRGKDGRRRITPKFLGYLDSPDEDTNSNPQFTSSIQSNKLSTPIKLENEEVQDLSSQLSDDNHNHDEKIDHNLNQTMNESSRVDLDSSNLIGSNSISELKSNDLSPVKTNTTLVNGHSVKSLTSDSLAIISDHNSTIENKGSSTSQTGQKHLIENSSNELITTSKRIRSESCEPDTNNTQLNLTKSNNNNFGKLFLTNKQRKKRVRLFMEDEKISRNNGSEINKSNSQIRKINFTPESSPPKQKLSDASHVDSSDTLSNLTNNQSNITSNVPTSSVLTTLSSSASSSSLSFVINTPEPLANVPKVQFVCSHPLDGPIIIQLINSAPSNSNAVTNLPSRIIATRGDRRLWELSVPDRLAAYAHTDYIIVVGDIKGHLHLIYSTGGRICPVLLLDSIHSLILRSNVNNTELTNLNDSSTTGNAGNMSRLCTVVSGNKELINRDTNYSSSISNQNNFNYHLVILCKSGRLTIWNLTFPSTMVFGYYSSVLNSSIFPHVLIETSIREFLISNPNTKFSSLSFGPSGYPVIHFQDGSSRLFHTDCGIWVELFDASDPLRCQFAVSTTRGCPTGSLSSCQLLSKAAASGQKLNSSTNSMNSSTLSAGRKIINQNFLESQTQAALTFGSAGEYRYWLIRWFRQLIEDNEEERVRQIFQSLIGPILSTSKTSWVSQVKGISKRILAKELLNLFALNMHLQRLYVELNEMFNESQNN